VFCVGFAAVLVAADTAQTHLCTFFIIASTSSSHVVWSSRDTDWTIQCASTSSHRLHMCVRASGSSCISRALPHKAGSVSQRCSHRLPPPFYRPVSDPTSVEVVHLSQDSYTRDPKKFSIFSISCTPALLRSVTRDPRSGPVC